MGLTAWKGGWAKISEECAESGSTLTSTDAVGHVPLTFPGVCLIDVALYNVLLLVNRMAIAFLSKKGAEGLYVRQLGPNQNPGYSLPQMIWFQIGISCLALRLEDSLIELEFDK